MYEFSIAFAWGTLAMYAYFERRYHQRVLGLIALPVALAMLLYAMTIPATIDPLVPALQNNLLLSVHVAVAIVAYGTFTVAFAAAVLYLVQGENGRRGLPQPRAARRDLLQGGGRRLPVPDPDDRPRRGLGRRRLGHLLELGSRRRPPRS